ncbi:MAG TPA: corrinoid protein [Armatimonadota bacterium]|jgi:5-methyltetrahydrofolate--homocysteine methyltransferase|nr:cobalamin-binding protein [Armatimonadota bacterium]HOJ19928.1 corrinoid protein [Armatimonadota bacterium]HPO74424.1 corrinoid protein [Armatimonadota bacterium]HPT96373.1 corrinoid protein [Armatimonadota bacterium]
MPSLLENLAQYVIDGNAQKAKETTDEALAQNVPVADIINKGLVAGMQVVGQKFKCNEFYIPEVLIAARAMKQSMEKLRPLIAESGIQPIARVAIGTVRGDLHDIGKNLVGMMLEGAGFEVIDLGTDVSPEKFVEAVREHKAEAIGLSALLTTTMPAMKETIAALEEAGLRDKVAVLVGGAPLTQAYADEIGADGYAPDAASAVDTAKQLLRITA